MTRFLAALGRALLHGKQREIWTLTEQVGRLVDQNRTAEARIRELDDGWAADRRRIAELRSLNNLARDLDAGIHCPDTLPEDMTP